MAKKFVSANQRITNVKKSIAKLQQHMQRVSRSITKINTSKTMAPKVKRLRVVRAKALISYLKASILYKQAVIANIKKPE